jgi:hypothetical protein
MFFNIFIKMIFLIKTFVYVHLIVQYDHIIKMYNMIMYLVFLLYYVHLMNIFKGK